MLRKICRIVVLRRMNMRLANVDMNSLKVLFRKVVMLMSVSIKKKKAWRVMNKYEEKVVNFKNY